jgi:hypothetical protein
MSASKVNICPIRIWPQINSETVFAPLLVEFQIQFRGSQRLIILLKVKFHSSYLISSLEPTHLAACLVGPLS